MQNADGKDINIDVASPSLQPFTKQQWRINQQYIINTVGYTSLFDQDNGMLSCLFFSYHDRVTKQIDQ